MTLPGHIPDADAATMLRISLRTLRNKCCGTTPQIKSVKIGRRRWIPESEIDRLIKVGTSHPVRLWKGQAA